MPLLLTDTAYPRLRVTLGGDDVARADLEIDAERFVGVKGFKAKGKRICIWTVDKVDELEPTRQLENNMQTATMDDGDDGTETENLDPDAGKSKQQIIDEMTGQLNLFNDDELGK